MALEESHGQQQKLPVVTYNQQNSTYNNARNNAVQAAIWSPDSRYVASASHDVQMWNSLSGEHIFTYTGHATSFRAAVQAVVWSPNGRYIASGGMEGSVQVWNAR